MNTNKHEFHEYGLREFLPIQFALIGGIRVKAF